MKIILSSDWHLRGSNPENRIDHFFLTQIDKIEQIFKIFNEKKCQYLLQAGDLFDSPRPSFEILQYIIKLFNKYNINNSNFFAVAGQHDTFYRNIDKTAFKLMEILNYVNICKTQKLSDDIYLYGSSWGDEIPVIEDMDCFNILLIHKTIIKKPLWVGQEDYLQSDRLFKNGYDITICGDNHHPVYYTYKEQTIVGCGCLVRKTIDEADLIPHVYILNIDESDFTYTLEKIDILHDSADKVFRKEALERTSKQDNKKMQEFINSIKSNEISSSLDFKKNLGVMLKSAEEEVKQIILKEMEDLNG